MEDYHLPGASKELPATLNDSEQKGNCMLTDTSTYMCTTLDLAKDPLLHKSLPSVLSAGFSI